VTFGDEIYLAILLAMTLLIGAIQIVMVNQINATGNQPKMRVWGQGLGEYFRTFRLHKKLYPGSWIRATSVLLTVLAWGILLFHRLLPPLQSR